MPKFKKNYLLLIFLAVVTSAGCNFAGSPTNNASEKDSVTSQSSDTVVAEKDQAKKEESLQSPLLRQKREADEKRILADGSHYLKMKDAYGNTSEFRYFDGNNPVKYISVQTLADGSTSMIIRTREGSIKHVKEMQIRDPWRSANSEILLLAGIAPEKLSQSEKKSSPVSPKVRAEGQTSEDNSKTKAETPLNSNEISSGKQSNKSTVSTTTGN